MFFPGGLNEITHKENYSRVLQIQHTHTHTHSVFVFGKFGWPDVRSSGDNFSGY